MKHVKVYIERAADGTFSASLANPLDLPYGLVGVGATADEAIADWQTCYKEMKELFASNGEPFVEADFSFAYDIPSFLLHYAGTFTYAGLASLTGVSAAQLSQYANGYRNPSAKTAAKIQKGLRAFAAELSRVQFV